MADTIPSPNMVMPVPVVSVDPGPDWASNINASLSIIDGHDHSTGRGVPVTPDGLDISSDLSFEANNATDMRTVRFEPQPAPLSAGTDIGCIYEVAADLYYNDGNGNQVRITQGGAVTGATGTITGLPSGTASASYAGGVFSFQSATNTPAETVVGSIVVSQEVASGFGVTIQANGSQAADYAVTLPAALPAAPALIQTDISGNLTFGTQIQTGTTSSTFTFNSAGGGTSSAVNIRYQRVGDWVTVFIPLVTATSGTNSSQFISDTPVPTWARPLTTNCVGECPVIIDNNVATTSVGILFARADGLYSMAKNKFFTFFTNSSICGIGDNFVTTYYVGTGS